MRIRHGLTGGLALALLAATWLPAGASDLDKYVPESSNFYMKIDVKQMCGASMIRKVLPRVLDKYGEPMVKMAGQANPQAGMLEAMWPQFQEMLRDQDTVNQFFDSFAENVSDVIIAGKAGDDGEMPNFVVVIGSPAFTRQNVEMISGMVGGQMPGMFKKEKVAGKDVWEVSPPGAPMSAYIAILEEGVLGFAMGKEQLEDTLKASGKPRFAKELEPLLKNRTSKCSIFVAAHNPEENEQTFAQIMIAKDLDVNMVSEFKSADQAKERAEEMNEGLDSGLSMLEGMLGDVGEMMKPMFDSLRKNKATVEGSKVTFKTSITADNVMKMLKD